MTIEHRTMDLFDAPAGAVLAHACNARGVWGTGIALGFMRRFPDAYRMYSKYCRTGHQDVAGHALLINAGGIPAREIACLITSRDYGDRRDSEAEILLHTSEAILSLEMELQQRSLTRDSAGAAGAEAALALDRMGERPREEVYMPRINSGMFAVPWEKTEAILQELVGKLPRRYIVCTPEGK